MSLADLIRQGRARHEARPENVAKALSGALATSARPATSAEPPRPAAPLKLSNLLDAAVTRGDPLAYKDINRIVALPIVEGFPEEREAFQRERVQATAYEAGFRLHPVQIDAVIAFARYGGLLGSIGVGCGKTAITLLAASSAYAAGKQRILLLVPPQVVSQLWLRDIPWARQKLVLYGCPFHLVAGSKEKRAALARSGKKGCYILPYSMLSTADSEEMLDSIAAPVLIADEAHHLRARNSARTKRLMRYVKKFSPSCAWLSGTITTKSIMDYHHLVTPFGPLCPQPLDRNLAEAWASALDAKSEITRNNIGPITPIIDWCRRAPHAPDVMPDIAGFRKAYQHRLVTSPCVVSTGDAEIGTSLTIRRIDAPLPEDASARTLRGMIDLVEREWVTPSGDEIEYAIHKYKWLRELSAGIYNDLFWPEPSVLATRKNLSIDVAAKLLERAKYHHALRQEYAKLLRNWLQRTHVAGLDTPMLVGQSLLRDGTRFVDDEKMYMFWKEAREIEEATPGMPERDSRVVRLCDYKIAAAARWAEEQKHGIIWYYHDGVGEWLRERIPDALYCPAGAAHDRAILETKGRMVLASISAHGTGKNLQFHQNQLFVQFPREANVAEQTLGRLHRFGQEADELFADMLMVAGTEPEGSFDEVCFAATLNDALYVQQTTGSRMKVIYANYDPLPRIFPTRVLEERGLDPRRLTKEQEALLAERFETQK